MRLAIMAKQPSITRAEITRKLPITRIRQGVTRVHAREHSEQASKAHTEEHGKK